MKKEKSSFVKKRITFIGVFTFLIYLSCDAQTVKPCVPNLSNGGFEQNVVGSSCWVSLNQSLVTEWNTTASDQMIEIWDGLCMGVPAYQGNQFAELNANMVSQLFVTICTPCPGIVNWQFAHRGRAGTDTCALKAGSPGGPYTTIGLFGDSSSSWGFYTGIYTVPSGQTETRFYFESVSSAGGSQGVGNFLDAVNFTFNGLILNTNTLANIGCATSTGSVSVSALGGLPPYTYTWLPGGGNNAIASGLSAGTYTVLVSDAGGCTDSAFAVVNTTGIPPQAGFTANPVCLGSTVSYLNSSVSQPNDTIVSWNWNMPNANPSISSLENPTAHYNNPGTYPVSLIVTTSSGCSDSITKLLVVYPNPQAGFSSNSVCEGINTLLFNTSLAQTGDPIISWNWSMPNASPAFSSIENPVTLFANPGTHTVSLLITTTFGCKDSVIHTVIVKPKPLLTANTLTHAICGLNSGSVIANVSGGTAPYTYDWTPGNGNTASLSGLTAGTFTVTVNDAEGCKDTASTLIMALGTPPHAGFNLSPVCVGSSALIVNTSVAQANDPIVSWNWSMPNATPSNTTSQNPSLLYNNAGTYTISLLALTAAGCKDSITQTIVIKPKPQALFTANNAGCTMFCTTYSNTSTSAYGNITSWQWSFPGGTPPVSGQDQPHVCYQFPGSYDVTLTVTDSIGCTDTKTIPAFINAYPQPEANFIINETSPEEILDPRINLTHLWSADVTQFQWNFGDNSGLNTTDINPGHSYNNGNNDFQTYLISLHVQNQYGCKDSIELPVYITPVFTFYMPNSFTPGNDDGNNEFFGKGMGIKQYTIEIFDRWGNLIWNCYETGTNRLYDDNEHEGMPSACKWDGKYKGNYVQQDTYVWKVNLTDIFGIKRNYKGIVSIIK